MLDNLLLLLGAAVKVFPQKRTRRRAMEMALGLLATFGCRTISRAICAIGRQHQDWSADYKIFSRSPWKPAGLFDPVVDHYLIRYPSGPIGVAVDATHLPRGGRKVPDAFWQRDPMSPRFHLNLVHGLRFVQAALIFPHHTEGEYAARTMPVTFEDAPPVKKPGKRATEEEWEAYKNAAKVRNLSQYGVDVIRNMRARLDQAGAHERELVISADGSFCNRIVFRAELARTTIVARCRKDAVLCFPAPAGERRIYRQETFTPEQVLRDEAIPYRTCMVFYGGCRRTLRYKEVRGVLWQGGAGRKPLRLIVLAPMPYQNSPNGRRMYREAAYLLVTETDLATPFLIQVYCDRWQIEVNHRDEKDIMGVGDAQVWSALATPRQPAFAVAVYSMLLLAGLLTFGPTRTPDFLALPKWRKRAKRPSALDLVTKVRDEIAQRGEDLTLFAKVAENTPRYAYA